MRNGYVQIYTGSGKGKTTAAIGLAARASLAGLRVLFLQFIKGGGYSECALPDHLPGIVWESYGEGRFIKGSPSPTDLVAAARGMIRLEGAVSSGEYDVVIADELCVAQSIGLISEEEGIALMKNKRPNVELVLTGRGAPASWMQAADLVTEMREIKHYFNSGVQARKGIEM